MKFVIAFLFLLPFLSFSQIKLKKKYCGNYSGMIPAYSMEIGNEIVGIDSAAIKIEILI